MTTPDWNELLFNTIRFDIPKLFTGAFLGVIGKSLWDTLYRRKRVQEMVSREISRQLEGREQ